jgi:hypothetical protein
VIVAVAAVALFMGAPEASATDAHQLNVTALPFDTYRDMAVDATHGHVFVSGGDLIVVTDLDGRIVKTIDAPGASGMELSDDSTTLYASLHGAREIVTISTTKLKITARHSVGLLCPRDLALAQGRVWFSHVCFEGRIGFSSLEFDGKRPVIKQWPWSSALAPQLAATKQWPDLLLVGTSIDELITYDISGGDPVLRFTAGEGPRARDFALTADGSQVVVAGTDHVALSTWSLMQVGTYSTGTQANAVAIGARNRVAAGVMNNAVGATDLFVFEEGASSPTWTFDFGGRTTHMDEVMAEHGLAWGPENSRLYAVTTHFGGSAPLLRVIAPSTASATALTLNYLGPVFSGDPTGLQVHLGGQLTALTGVAPGEQTLHVVRQDPLGEVQLPDVRTDATGNYDFHDVLRGPGLTTYTVTFDGAGDFGASQKSLSFDLSSG